MFLQVITNLVFKVREYIYRSYKKIAEKFINNKDAFLISTYLSTKQLIKLDSTNSQVYISNSNKALAELDNLIQNIQKDLNKDLRFVVFHDAYQYFENRFDIQVLGALTIKPDIKPGAEQLSEIREVIEHEKANCLFSEPQFNPAIIKSIAKDTNVKTGIRDTLGAKVDKGKNVYFNLLKDMSSSFKGC